MKGIKELVTETEIEIASMLSESRASVFLESRGNLRKSLATLFDLNPLEIPIEAHPSKPPKLLNGMGNISISHCHDALIIIWHIDKIGIDIERSDRNFKYEEIAKKYFRNTNLKPKSYVLNKHAVLKQWSATEAAIKLNRGTLAKDLKEWQYLKTKNSLFHKTKKITVFFSQFNFYQWTVSIAYDDKKYMIKPEIVCNNLNNNY